MTQEKPVWIWIDEDEIPLEAAAIMNSMDQRMIACAVADLWHRTRGTVVEDEGVEDAIARFFVEDVKHDWHRHSAPDVYEPPLEGDE
jgi:hypothetical protein